MLLLDFQYAAGLSAGWRPDSARVALVPAGEIRSLQIASVIGLVGRRRSCCSALSMSWSIWTGIMAFFLLSRAIAGWQYAKAMVAEKKAAETPPILPQV